MTNGPTPSGGGNKPTTKATLGLTGLTINAMALIAPGAFLWLTFQIQSLYGAPMAGCAMWFGILAALLLCFATAISYAELSKLYPGAGSRILYAEQAFLSEDNALQVRARRQVLHRLGEPPVLLGLSRLHGGRDGDSGRLSAEPVLAGHVQRHL